MHEWVLDNNLTPYVIVNTTVSEVEVPSGHAENGRIVLNLSPSAIRNLNIGNERLGRQPALDQPRRRRSLNHHILAGPAAVFGAADHDHPQLRRNDVEPLARILADLV